MSVKGAQLLQHLSDPRGLPSALGTMYVIARQCLLFLDFTVCCLGSWVAGEWFAMHGHTEGWSSAGHTKLQGVFTITLLNAYFILRTLHVW